MICHQIDGNVFWVEDNRADKPVADRALAGSKPLEADKAEGIPLRGEDTVADMEEDMAADTEVDTAVGTEVDTAVGMAADMAADMARNKVAEPARNIVVLGNTHFGLYSIRRCQRQRCCY